MVGDRRSDLISGKNAGCLHSFLVRTGYGAGEEKEGRGEGFAVFDDLRQAAAAVLEQNI